MEIKTLEESATPNEIVRHFTSLGSEASLRYIQGLVASCDLAPEIPDHVRDQFETCCKLHVYGYFVWEFFTAATRLAYMTLEAALGAKFLTCFPNGVPLVHKRDGECVLNPPNFGELATTLSTGEHPRWRVQGLPDFNGSMRSLLDWARSEQLLYGQRNKVVEGAILGLRNVVGAHLHTSFAVGPIDSARAIHDVAEIINHLWDRDTPGGRFYGDPVAKNLFGIQWAPDGSKHICDATRIHAVPHKEREGQWFLLEAAEDDRENLVGWHPDLETTAYPTTLISKGASWEGVLVAVDEYQAAGRTPQLNRWRNRIFLVRCHDGGFEACRSPEQFRQLAPEDRDRPNKRWRIVKADHPSDVYWYMQAQVHAAYDASKENRQFSVEYLGEYETWAEAEQRLRAVEKSEAIL